MSPSSRLFSQGAFTRLSTPIFNFQFLPSQTVGKQAFSIAKTPYARSLHLYANSTRPRLSNNIRNHAIRPKFQSRNPRRLKSSESSESSSSSNLSFSQRMKKLSREYGWSALGVYLALSALDFPFCFAAVRLLGVDRIGHYEHVLVEGAKNILGTVLPTGTQEPSGGAGETQVPEGEPVGSSDMAMAAGGAEASEPYDHGVKEAEARNAGPEASLWTQLALAYAIHKSFIFLRVPLTAAVTPKVVKILRRWGWDIGKRKLKST
ncbi:hypothetical protein AJ79_09876 [Helicocarpus griseus UAMH5409]|uniref:DUF1279 domain-containing protein n=1 Tax=Helicocarpus griseus UAMH5409 TaxID=1447875 RepID=A0A2B7WH42_9EURO|nr:hypothetical protein AJ79_09876 [Helicocarpus griseus UAMH5409]